MMSKGSKVCCFEKGGVEMEDEEKSVCDDCETRDDYWECHFCCSKCFEDYGECPFPDDCNPFDI